jgi:hypothetical protein
MSSRKLIKSSDGNSDLDRSWNHRFAYLIKSLEELNPDARSWIEQQLFPGEIVSQIIFAPRQSFSTALKGGISRLFSFLSWKISPDCILVVTDRHLLLVTIPVGGEPSFTATPIHHIVSVEVGKILLYSWFEWVWVEDGHLNRNRIYFNTVSERYFDRAVTDITCNLTYFDKLNSQPENCHQFSLATIPFKFHVRVRQILLSGEQVQIYYFRPTVWKGRFSLTSRITTTAALLLLTNLHLVIIEEEQNQIGSSYGIITRWYPRRIVGPAIVEHTQEQCRLRFEINCEGATKDLFFDISPVVESKLDRLLPQWFSHKRVLQT